MNRNILPRLLLSAAALASLGACTTVGPNYAGAPSTAPVSAERAAFLRGGERTTTAAPIARWWETLGDPQLDRLIDDALAHSPSIAMAQARITQARAGLAANKAGVLPTVNTSVSAPYINIPGNLLNPNSSSDRTDMQRYSLGFDASWELDLFGGTRRKVEAASDRAEATAAGLADAQVSLSAEVTRAYVGLRARQAALQVLERQGVIDAELVSLAEQRLRLGTAPQQPLDQARAQLAQSEGQIASTRAEVTVLTDQLAVLTGAEPGTLDSALASATPIPLPPSEVAVGDPALLLRSRPDIRIAERQLAAANADIGSAIADRFPKISFLGLLGTGGGTVGSLTDTGSLIGLILPRISWTLFDGGRGAAKVASSRGAFAEAEGKYRATVLSALGDAETSLTRFGSDRIELGKALEAEARTLNAARLQQQRFIGGTATRSDALGAERQGLQVSLAAQNARAELTSDYVAVAKALGLGWAPQTPEK
ncbi:MAG: efflux transporter outer membrane subunit [Sphingomonadales bacterium]|nr:efflux transporter outer membrane subunit [Sphingomonadales bacterium]